MLEQSGPRSCVNSDPALTKTMLEHRMADTELKTCFSCKQQLPRLAFHKAANRPDGLYPYCRKCDAGKRAAKKATDPEWAAEQARKKRKYDAVYNQVHKERKRQQVLARYRAKSEEIKTRIREWQQANPDKVRAYKANTKAIRRSQTQTGMSGAELSAWKTQQKKVCHWCGQSCAKKFHVDHIKPLSRGGAHEAKNLVISCPTCNLRKLAKDPLDFARELGKLL